MIRILKTVHGWLGFFVLPWIIIMGLSGLYLNHPKLVYKYLPAPSYDERQFDKFPGAKPLDEAGAKAVAMAVFPGEKVYLTKDKTYHKRPVFTYESETGRIILAAKTGHYWVKSRYTRKTYDPNGKLLDTKIYWGAMFKTLHTRGWATGALGTWLADITAAAMVVFGSTGIFMFLVPRLRRLKNRKAARATASIAPTFAGITPPPSGNVPRPKRIKLKG